MTLVKKQFSLPQALVRMLSEGTWKHPGDKVLSRIVPFIEDPLEFRSSEESIFSHQDYLLAPDEAENILFHEYRGSMIDGRGLPWRDIESSFLIAINKHPGDDVAIALDYRSSVDNPRVIASEWIEGPDGGCFWREIASTFTEFVERLSIEQETQKK